MTQTDQTAEPEPPGGLSERTARLILAAVALLAVWGIVTAFPWVAYVVLGALGTVGTQRARAWRGRRRQGPPENEPTEPVDITDHLRALSDGGTSGVLLTQIQKAADLPDTRNVRNLLHAADIRVREGVRTPAGNGPGVHKDDIPAPPPSATDADADGCCCRSGANTNANNDAAPPPGERLRVEAIGHAGTVVHDPA
ncbi:hypothetical protein ACF068_14595 [Streptomyces sp. NPDC016309]|uniref:hypothetical protein n=1 Tax=Streptomyces sp. NPDC016309 TaxID=3364965 RepID=UPI0036F85DE0